VRAAAMLLAVLALASDAPPGDVSGRWAMSWQTHKHGIRKSSFLVITQKGSSLDVVLQGDGELRASGVLRGNEIHIAGRKMLVPFTIDAVLDDHQVLRGSLKTAGIEKPFTAERER
jgi:hypothetical protein